MRDCQIEFFNISGIIKGKHGGIQRQEGKNTVHPRSGRGSDDVQMSTDICQVET